MADVKTFEEFVTTRSSTFLRLAYALTRDYTAAEDLLQTALARSWPKWKRIADDPEPYVRKVIVNTHNTWWRRRWNGEHPTESLPDTENVHPQSSVDDRDEVWRALGRLPKRQRAVLVLRYFEDMTEAQIAETLGMATGTVKSYAAKGLAKLRSDPSLVNIPEPPHGTERLVAVKERITRRRQTRALTIATVVMAVITTLLAGSTVAANLPPAGPGGFPLYQRGHKVVAGQRASFEQIRNGASFTWVPGSLAPRLYPTCELDAEGVTMWIAAEINGVRFGGVTCTEKTRMRQGGVNYLSEDHLREAGVRLGVPVTVRILLLPMSGAIPRKGRAAVGLGEPVPWKDYPFPRRPRALVSLDRKEMRPALEAGGARTVTLKAHQYYILHARSQTPGLLHIYLNGKFKHTLGWWTYNGDIETMVVGEGGEDTLTVVPEHFTGDWFLAVGKL